jgi:hypothetical protein
METCLSFISQLRKLLRCYYCSIRQKPKLREIKILHCRRKENTSCVLWCKFENLFLWKQNPLFICTTRCDISPSSVFQTYLKSVMSRDTSHTTVDNARESTWDIDMYNGRYVGWPVSTYSLHLNQWVRGGGCSYLHLMELTYTPSHLSKAKPPSRLIHITRLTQINATSWDLRLSAW